MLCFRIDLVLMLILLVHVDQALLSDLIRNSRRTYFLIFKRRKSDLL